MIAADTLWKIRTMYLSNDKEDKELAFAWLKRDADEKDAAANLFVLLFYKDWESDSDLIVDDNNYCGMKFSTYKISFGKDYRYRIRMVAVFDGKVLVSEENDYSRWQVGNGEPKIDFCQLVCDNMRKQGIKFYDGLFVKK